MNSDPKEVEPISGQVNRIIKTKIILYRLRDEDGFYLECMDHGAWKYYPNLRKARFYLTAPWVWCHKCGNILHPLPQVRAQEGTVYYGICGICQRKSTIGTTDPRLSIRMAERSGFKMIEGLLVCRRCRGKSQ